MSGLIPSIPAKTILSGYTENGWFGSNYNMNIYKGCCHGCIYCDSRSDCYRVEDFDTVRMKENALAVIERDLKSKRKKGMIINGSMSDSYNPFERELELMRGALRLAARYGFGVAIDTKSDLVVRDIDLLRDITKLMPACVNLTITAADDALSRKLEQHVCPTSHRLAAMQKLSSAGIPCGALLMPILPFITDTEDNILSIVRSVAAAGGRWIYPGMGVTLRTNQREHFYDKLDAHFPGLRARYIQTFGDTYGCRSPNSDRLWALFTDECERLRLAYRMRDIVQLIWRDYRVEQLELV